MNSLSAYLLELNIALIILFAAFKLFFERDGNFRVRRIYLMAIVLLPVILPLLPDALRMPVGNIAPLSIQLEGVTIVGQGETTGTSGSLSVSRIATLVYLVVVGLGILKLFIQLARICMAAISSKRIEVNGSTLLANRNYHASSFFKLVFIDPDSLDDNSISHILEHENTHSREYHSIDRILTELFVIINWFNPVVWLFRRAVIRNLEYLADSAVLKNGTDPHKYQLSILNQYIGSASISNQFSSQIKNRIIMLNKNYKLGSTWKIAMLIPLAAIAFFFISCSDRDAVADVPITEDPNTEISSIAGMDNVFLVVEEMPTFNGGEPIEFRKHIARNLKYPNEAVEAGVSGKIFIKFIVNSEGEVVIPDQETIAKIEGKPIDEVVVVAYRTLNEEDTTPNEKHIELLKEEVKRVVSQSPDWTPGKQRGKEVNVMFTFPVTFALQ